MGKIQYILGQREITVWDTVYTDKVEMEVLTPRKELKAVTAEITEGTNGQAVMLEGDSCYLAKLDGKMQIV